jgi:D-alanyl-D-alanine carboxypeptidase/D-alanyl-D-alanine-endopeptidase (penicillin-binding protein 4)
MKTLLSACVLEYFGNDYQFKTHILSTTLPHKGVLNGDIYLVGRGDPGLMKQDLLDAAKQLKELGIQEIKGNLIYDTTFLDSEPPRYSPSARFYYTPPSALNVNFNTIEYHIKENKNGTPTLGLKHWTAYADLNHIKGSIVSSNKAFRPKVTYAAQHHGDRYTINGDVSTEDEKNFYLKFGVSRPGLLTATLFKESLRTHGIRVGEIIQGKSPHYGITLHIITTDTLKHLVYQLNQDSNNLIAEVLNKNLGAYFVSPPGTREKGLALMERYIEAIVKNDITIRDSSGLSIENRLTSEDMSKLLQYAYLNESMREAFMATLVRQGFHPLHSEFSPPEHLDVRLKTGTLSMTGVNTVAGYIMNKETDDVYVFAILTNRETPGKRTFTGTLTNPILENILSLL